MDRERLRWWREELEDSVYQPLGEEDCKEIAALLKDAEAQEQRIEELKSALLPFAKAGYEQTGRFAAWNGACFLPPEPEETITLASEEIDQVHEVLGVIRNEDDVWVIDASVLED